MGRAAGGGMGAERRAETADAAAAQTPPVAPPSVRPAHTSDRELFLKYNLRLEKMS